MELLGRWHAAAGRFGYMLLESNDPSAIFRFASEWQDVCDLEVTPVIEDEEAGAVLADLRK